MLSICKWHKVIKVHKLGLKQFNLKIKSVESYKNESMDMYKNVQVTKMVVTCKNISPSRDSKVLFRAEI